MPALPAWANALVMPFLWLKKPGCRKGSCRGLTQLQGSDASIVRFAGYSSEASRTFPDSYFWLALPCFLVVAKNKTTTHTKKEMVLRVGLETMGLGRSRAINVMKESKMNSIRSPRKRGNQDKS